MSPYDPADKNLRATDGGPVRSADDVLPPVQAPSAGFLLQLFFIPLLIVLIIVAVWAMFSWLVQLGSNPRDLVGGIRALNDASWQKAFQLADFLRNPEYDYLKDDKQIARELAAVLDSEIEEASMNDKRVRLRMYLCRVLGEFRVPEVMPALVKAARTEREPAEMDVRRSAAQALAVLADQLGAEAVRSQPGAIEALMEMSREQGQSSEEAPARAELRSSAAYALGVIGGEEALDRLVRMLGDAHPNTRYNAATGLARHGDPRAEPVLIEMLAPTNAEAVASEESDAAKQQKHFQVMAAGISAAARLGQSPDNADLSALRGALKKLSDSKVPNKIRVHAREALLALESR